MSNYKRRRSALLNVIQGLEDSDFVSDEVLELDEIEETIPQEEVLESEEPMLPEDEDQDTIISDEQLEEVLASLEDGQLQAQEEQIEVEQELQEEENLVASQEFPGIEDEIQDTANGGEPTTSQIAPGGEQAKGEVSTDAEVFPTNSEYVAQVVEKLDDIAGTLEKMGMKKLAFRIDTLSDKLELSKRK